MTKEFWLQQRRSFFHREQNKIFRQLMVGVILLFILTVWGFAQYAQSDFVTRRTEEIIQPIQFSHEHHISALGIDCRYCHTTVETKAHAGMPTTHTCLTCHQGIWQDSPELKAVFLSRESNIGIKWQRVYNLPDHVYFNHSIHINKGVSCLSCHGDVGQMPLIRLNQPLTMQWCLQCHKKQQDSRLLDCYVCHR